VVEKCFIRLTADKFSRYNTSNRKRPRCFKMEKKEFSTKQEKKEEKIETCYFCNRKFDMNKDDSSHYKYGKYPVCDYCSEFYGFYSD
jgi:hypothetical protein